MIEAILGAITLLASASETPEASSPPLVVQEDQKLFLPPPPETPVVSVEVAWGRMSEWTPWVNGQQASEAIRKEVRPEPFMVDSIDETNHAVRIRTSAFGRSILQRSLFKVANPGDEYDWIHEACDEFIVNFKVGETGPALGDVGRYSDRLCPHGEEIDPERNLIVEGVNGQGHRIFVALSEDPRWHVYETGDATGAIELLRRGRDEDAETYVSFSVSPFSDDLEKLNIWQFDADGEGRVIAVVQLSNHNK